MKVFLFIAALFALVSSQINDFTFSYGCSIPPGETKCCWMNRNGCCQAPKKGQMCTMAITRCCKTKVFDGNTKSYKFIYNKQ